MRYIDIDKAIPIAIQAVVDVVGHGISQIDAVRIAEKLEEAPTADVVEVVRCKDCVHFTEGMAIGMCKRNEEKPIIPCRFDNYCMFGKRREKNEG